MLALILGYFKLKKMSDVDRLSRKMQESSLTYCEDERSVLIDHPVGRGQGTGNTALVFGIASE